MKIDEQEARLRHEFNEARRLNLIDLNSGSFQLIQFQVLQEMEKRRQDCMAEVESLRSKAMAAEHQAYAFAAVGSVLVATIHGMVENHKRALDEELRRAKARAEEEREAREEADNALLTVNNPEEQNSDTDLNQDIIKVKKQVKLKKPKSDDQ